MPLTFEVSKGNESFRRTAKILNNYATGRQLYSFGVFFISGIAPVVIARHNANKENFVICNAIDKDRYISEDYEIVAWVG